MEKKKGGGAILEIDSESFWKYVDSYIVFMLPLKLKGLNSACVWTPRPHNKDHITSHSPGPNKLALLLTARNSPT